MGTTLETTMDAFAGRQEFEARGPRDAWKLITRKSSGESLVISIDCFGLIEVSVYSGPI